MRAVALLGLHADENAVRTFQAPGVNIFSGNDLDPGDRPDAALIFGGDGTVHRHLPVLSANQVPTLVAPMGSANDFAKSVGINSVGDAIDAWQRFCAGAQNIRTLNLGTITAAAPPANPRSDPWETDTLERLHFVPDGPGVDLPRMGGRIMQSQLRRAGESQVAIAGPILFACIAGTGLDAAVNRHTLDQPRWVRGHGGYVLALLQTLWGFRPPRFRISAEVNGDWRTLVDEAGFLAAIGNGPQYGSGMRLTHHAQMDDGLLDICFVRLLSKLRLLRLFHVVFRGAHIGMEEVEYWTTERVRLETEPVTEVFADGEYICRTPVEIAIRIDGLRAIVPS